METRGTRGQRNGVSDTEIIGESPFESAVEFAGAVVPIGFHRFRDVADFTLGDGRPGNGNAFHDRPLDTNRASGILALAGTPTTISPSRTSRVTTAPAPMTASAPTVI